MSFCRQCGKPIPTDAVFCPNCGQKIQTTVPYPSSTQPPVITVYYENLLMQQESTLFAVEKPHVEEVQSTASKVDRKIQAGNEGMQAMWFPQQSDYHLARQRQLSQRPRSLLDVMGDVLVLTDKRLFVAKNGKISYWAAVGHDYARQILEETRIRNDEAMKKYKETSFWQKMSHRPREFGWIPSIDVLTDADVKQEKGLSGILGWRSLEFGTETFLWPNYPGSKHLLGASRHRKYKIKVTPNEKLDQLLEALNPKIREMASNIEAIKTQHKQSG